MSRTQQEKQQAFRQKLQEEGADSFADGPRPWEQWDESGNQYDNRIWEGTARRIHPKRRGARGFGERLLSGLAVVALASMVVGIAGVYFSTPSPHSTPQQARTLIQPPPIVTRKMTAPPATPLAEPAETATPVLARLDTLSPPAAGTTVVPDERKTVLEPTLTAPWTDPLVPSGNLDEVAVETVITEETVTTTVYTRQLSQDEPAVVAMVATTTPPFTHAATQNNEPAIIEQTAGVATESTVVAQADSIDIEPAAVEQAAGVATESIIVAQADSVDIEPAAVKQAAAVATEPAVVVQADSVDIEPAVIEQTAEVATESIVVAQADSVDIEPAAVEQATAVATEPAVVAQDDSVDIEPAAVEQATAVATEPAVAAPADSVDIEPAAVKQATAVATEPAVVAQDDSVDIEPAAVEQATAVATEPAVAAPAGNADTEPAVAEETAKPATEAAPVTADTASDAAAAPDVTPEPETATDIPVPPKAKTGKWVINLSSYTRKRTAERMLAVFRKKGVDGEVFTTTVNDKPIHRIRVTGFESARSARAGISALEQQLDLDGAWISKR